MRHELYYMRSTFEERPLEDGSRVLLTRMGILAQWESGLRIAERDTLSIGVQVELTGLRLDRVGALRDVDTKRRQRYHRLTRQLYSP